MPGKDPLSQLGDLEALQANADRIIEIVSGISTAIKEVPGITLKYKEASGGAELKKTTDDLIKSNNELTQAQKLLNAEQEKAKTLEGDLALRIAQNREANKARSKELQEEARATLGLNDAYKKLTLQYQEAARAAKNLAATPGADPKQVEAANAKAKGLSDQLKSIDAAVGQHQRNVGNYSGALKTLQTALDDANSRLGKMAAAGEQNSKESQRLTAETRLLNQLIGQQAQGFTSLSREVMATGKALETMAQAGMEGSEAFARLEEQYVTSRRELNEFRKDQQLITSEAPGLAALTLTAKGLGGAYALAAGGAALLSDGNEKVEKELNKLVAIMTILQGLNEVHELIEKRTAVAVIASGIAQRFKNFIMTGSTKATEANTEALMENVAAQEGDAEAAAEATETIEAETAATEATTVATEGAAAGMVALRIALIATGIGAILVLLVSAASAMGSFGKSAKETAEEMAALAEAIEKVNEAIMEQADLMNESVKDQKKLLEAQLEYGEKAGKDFYTQVAIKKQINELDRQMAENNLKAASGQSDVTKAVEATKNAREKDGAVYNKILAIQLDQESAHSAAIKRGKAENEKDFKARQEAREKEITAAKKKFDDDVKLLDDYENAEKEHNSLRIETEKFTEDELRELAKATATTRAQAVIDSNALILSDERSTQQQRLAAESSNLVQQLRIIEADRKARLSASGVTPVQAQTINTEANAQVVKARQDALDKIQKINQDYQKRENAAEYQIMKDGIESRSKIAEADASNIKLSLNQRLAAYEEYEVRQRQLINADADYQRQKAGLTSEELFAIEVQRQQKLTDLHTAGQAKQSEIILNALEQQNKHLNDSGQLTGLKQEISALNELNDAYRRGAISAEEFAKKKDEISNKASQEALNIQLVTLQFIQGEYKKYGEDTMAIDLQIANLRKQLADRQLQQDELNAERKTKLQDKEIQLAKQTEETISAFIKGRYEKEINAIQAKIDTNDRAKEKEVSNIETSSLSAEQKAAAQIELNAKVNAQNEALQRRQRQEKIKEAEFDRTKGLLDVGINTAVAISHDLKSYGMPAAIPFIALDAAMGAAQIAAILARPVPKYAHGTKSSQEGWALTDELGPELYKTRRGETFVGSNQGPTYRYLEAGTEITPFGQYGQPETELISYEQLKQYRQLWPITQMQTQPVQQADIRRELRELKEAYTETGRDIVRAIEKNKPLPPPPKQDPGPAFWAHIYNSNS